MYGKDKEKMLEWAEKQENVNFLGTWKQNEVLKKMNK